jgi:hypothetical protein
MYIQLVMIVLNDNEKLVGKVWDKMVVKGKNFIQVKGDNVVIDDCRFFHPDKDFEALIRVDGKNCQINNCVFAEFDVNGALIVLSRKDRLDSPDNLIVKDCLFMNRRATKENNGLEAIRLGYSGSSLQGKGMNIVINNRFENYDGEIEVISVKCNNNLIVNNELVNCAGTITLRHGDNNVVSHNFIDGKAKRDSGGIRVVGKGHFINKNVLQNIKGNGTMRCGISVMCGVPNGELNEYDMVDGLNITDNIFVSNDICYAIGVKKGKAVEKPKNIALSGNRYDNNKDIHSSHKDIIGGLYVSEQGIRKGNYDTKIKKFNLLPYDQLLDRLYYEEPEEKENDEPEQKDDEETVRNLCECKTLIKKSYFAGVSKDIKGFMKTMDELSKQLELMRTEMGKMLN